MKYKKYPSYKDSGVEWLGEIPIEWNITKVKHKFLLGRGRVISLEGLEEEGEYPVYSSQTKNNGILGYINSYDFDCKQITWTTDGANAGTVFLREGKHNCTNVCGTLLPIKKNENLEYLTYILGYATTFYKRPDTNGAKIMNGEMSEIFLTFPPVEEQQQISNFLNKVTAKIDTLIEKQTKQIELLKEKRQAVISHAVTKGINPNVPMKDSGVEWLGEIPEHWEVSKLKYKILKLESGTSVNAADIPANQNEYGVLKTSCVYTEKFRHNENKTVVQEEIYRLSCPLQKNTLIVSRMNTPELVGATGYVQNTHINIFLPDRLWQVYFTCNTRLIHYITLTKLYRNYIKTVCDGTSSSMQNLTQEDFKDFVCALPFSFDEQKEIVNYLDEKTSKIDTLIEKSNKSIELLKEKRTALISACVTGKIDVRELV